MILVRCRVRRRAYRARHGEHDAARYAGRIPELR